MYHTFGRTHPAPVTTDYGRLILVAQVLPRTDLNAEVRITYSECQESGTSSNTPSATTHDPYVLNYRILNQIDANRHLRPKNLSHEIS